ncbi:hypothetical protein [Paraburkholderia sp.]|uniref:hypothetical protein n=1 Tax=Paraburkholderia sp. TaxID=1926495 RepID=UPI0025FC0E08|nr:hypothetical protein [Paraburkholderia sp.]
MQTPVKQGEAASRTEQRSTASRTRRLRGCAGNTANRSTLKISPVKRAGKLAIRGKVVRSVTAWPTERVGNRGALEILCDSPKRSYCSRSMATAWVDG